MYTRDARVVRAKNEKRQRRDDDLLQDSTRGRRRRVHIFDRSSLRARAVRRRRPRVRPSARPLREMERLERMFNEAAARAAPASARRPLPGESDSDDDKPDPTAAERIVRAHADGDFDR